MTLFSENGTKKGFRGATTRPKTLKTVDDHLDWLGHDLDFATNTLGEPTQWAPGTWERVEVMRLRVERGQCVFHPDDATFTDGLGKVRPRHEKPYHSAAMPPVAIPRMARVMRAGEARD